LNVRHLSTAEQIHALAIAERSLAHAHQHDILQHLAGLNQKLHSAQPGLPFDPEVVAELRAAFPPSSATNPMRFSPSSPPSKGGFISSAPAVTLQDYFKPQQQPAEHGIKRTKHGTIIRVCCGDVNPSAKVAAFDMDGTLILPKSGAKFPKNAMDWKWKFANVPTILTKLHASGYKIVIFSNQKNVKEERLDDVVTKIGDLSKNVGVPIEAFIATADDDGRKPKTGMWTLFLSNNGAFSKKTLLLDVFFVGDAAGRQGLGKGKADFSDSDRIFAQNISIQYWNETEFFNTHANRILVRKKK